MSTAIKFRNVSGHVKAIDWSAVAADLDAQGWAILPKLLATKECTAVARLYGEEQGFRSHIVMARHGFGRGEYKYFAYPLPPLVERLRTALYPYLASIANRLQNILAAPTGAYINHDYLGDCPLRPIKSKV